MTVAHVVLGAAVFVAAFTQGVIGFGFGLLIMAVLPLVMPLQAAVGTVAVCGLFVCLYLLWRYRRHVDWADVARLCAGGAFGLPLGVWVLRDLPAELCMRVLGALLVLYAGWNLAAGRRSRPVEREPVATGWGYPAGLLGGVLGGAFGTGGPPVVIYADCRKYAPMLFRGVIQGFSRSPTRFTWCSWLATTCSQGCRPGGSAGSPPRTARRLARCALWRSHASGALSCHRPRRVAPDGRELRRAGSLTCPSCPRSRPRHASSNRT